LTWRAVFLASDIPNAISNCQIFREILALKTRVISLPIIRRQIIQCSDAPRQEATAERAVCDQRYSKIAQRGQQKHPQILASKAKIPFARLQLGEPPAPAGASALRLQKVQDAGPYRAVPAQRLPQPSLQ
jgi:hypothetical protein